MTIENAPVAIGAIGGSGTRKVAQFLRDIGYYMGSDINGSNDNLWFTLLFKRPDVLIEPRHTFERLIELFYQRMTEQFIPDEEAERIIAHLVKRPRPQHPSDWLQARADSLLRTCAADGGGPPWGWKEPNTHIVIDRLLESDQRLRYIHVTRNGLDLALSANQNQLRLWGSIFLGREVSVTPRDSLAYWCAVHRRMRVIASRYNDRIMFLDFDRFCAEPEAVCHEVLSFVGREAPDALTKEFAAKVVMPDSIGRFRSAKAPDFDPSDMAYAASCGYAVA